MLIVFVLGGLLVGQLMAEVVVLWLMGRKLKVERATLWRSLGAVLGAKVGVVVAAVGASTGAALWRTTGGVAVEMLFVIAAGFAAHMAVVKVCFGTTIGKAALMTVATYVGVGAVGVGAALVVRVTVCQAFVVPTGAMAPTIYGRHFDVTCEQCGYQYATSPRHMALIGAGRPYPIDPNPDPFPIDCPMCGGENSVPTGAPLRDGDRLLASLVGQPQRFDVIVFDSPKDYHQRFVCRLVGLPGETIHIKDGDVFVNGRRLVKQPGEAMELWLLVDDTAHTGNDPSADDLKWRTPVDHSTGWSFADGTWTSVPQGALELGRKITAAQPYNTLYGRRESGPPVMDVKIECTIAQWTSDSALAWTWGSADRPITATIDGSGTRIVQAAEAEPSPPRVKNVLPFRSGDRIAFARRDGQYYILHNDAVLATWTDSTPQQSPYDPIGTLTASGGTVAVSRIRTWRDVYYLAPSEQIGNAQFGEESDPLTLAADQYFVLGDNSSRAMDSRFYGPLPMSNFVGIARWCYAPLGRWHAYR